MIRSFKSKWYGSTEEALVESEIDLLQQSGLDLTQIRINNIRIELDPNKRFIAAANKDEIFIHTVTIKSTQEQRQRISSESQLKLSGVTDEQKHNNRRVLFLPGFGASASSYCFLWNELSYFFDITTVDLLGLGCSGHPKFLAFELEQVIDYFVSQLRSWMDQTRFDEKSKGKYTIIAHSMGCYVATHYIKHFPEMIDQVVFLSPAGMTCAPADFDPKQHISKQDGSGKRALLTLSHALWEYHPPPSLPFKLPGFYGGRWLHRQWLKRFKNLNGEDQTKFSRFVLETGLQKTSAERCLCVIFNIGGYAQGYPIVEQFQQTLHLQEIPITFTYGVEMFKREPADMLVSDGTLKKARVLTIAESGHHAYMDNPKGTLEAILNSFLDNERKYNQIT